MEVQDEYEVRAGRMVPSGKTYTADKRSGSLRFSLDTMGAVHLCWKERGAPSNELSVVIYQTEATVSKAPVPGRIVKVAFTNNQAQQAPHAGQERSLFFWLQSKDESLDQSVIASINALLSRAAVRPTATLSFDGAPAAPTTSSNTATPQPSTPQQQSNPVGGFGMAPLLPPSLFPVDLTLDGLQSMLSSIVPPVSATPKLELEKILTIDNLVSFLTTLESSESESLLQHLPEEHETLFDEINSAQFLQAVESFGAALRGGQIRTIFVHFGLNPSSISSSDGVEAFLTAIQRQVDATKKQ